MMAKITKGKGFRGVVNYVLGKEKAELLYAEGVRAKDKESIIQSFIVQSRMKPNITKPVAHISLNFSAQDKDKLTDKFMVAVAQQYLKAMGYKDTQYIIARHHDREHPHIHIVINRIDNRAQCISDQNDRLRSTKICMALTKQYGLYIAPDKEHVKRHRLTEPDKSKYAIYDALQAAIPKCKNWDELKAALQRQGITFDFQHNGSTDKIQGVRFMKNGYSFNGSKVDRSCSYSKIDWQLKQNERAQSAAIKHEQDLHSTQPSTAESLASSIGGLFDMQPTATSDAQDQADYWLYRKKKKKPKKGFRL
jgi:hypothetical protein